MTSPETKWEAVGDGVLSLPTTKFLITYVHGSSVPFQVTWNGHPIPSGKRSALQDAKSAAEEHMQDLIVMGFEV